MGPSLARELSFDGWDGVWERVRGYGGETTELIERYDVLCRPYRGHVLPGDDLVHGDLNVGNVIVDNGRVAGIIDIEAAGGGSRTYDSQNRVRHGACRLLELLDA